MLSFEHTNVMSLIGVCIDGEMPLLIMPFMSNGSVLEFVKHHRDEMFCTDSEWYIKVKTLQTSEILLQLASIGMVYNTDFCTLLRFCSLL